MYVLEKKFGSKLEKKIANFNPILVIWLQTLFFLFAQVSR